MSKKSSEPPLKKPALLTTPSPTKVVLPEWYQKYSQEAFVHDNEFDETKIHSESYDTKIGHLKGKKHNENMRITPKNNWIRNVEIVYIELFKQLWQMNRNSSNQSVKSLQKCKQTLDVAIWREILPMCQKKLKNGIWQVFFPIFQMSKIGSKRRLLLTGSIHTYLG